MFLSFMITPPCQIRQSSGHKFVPCVGWETGNPTSLTLTNQPTKQTKKITHAKCKNHVPEASALAHKILREEQTGQLCSRLGGSHDHHVDYIPKKTHQNKTRHFPQAGQVSARHILVFR